MPPSVQSPDRGVAVLVLGILGLVVCFPVGIAAWVMGNTDLRAMEHGTMDPAGRSLTQAGRWLGIIGVWLGLFGLLLAAVWIAFWCVVAASGH